MKVVYETMLGRIADEANKAVREGKKIKEIQLNDFQWAQLRNEAMMYSNYYQMCAHDWVICCGVRVVRV